MRLRTREQATEYANVIWGHIGLVVLKHYTVGVLVDDIKRKDVINLVRQEYQGLIGAIMAGLEFYPTVYGTMIPLPHCTLTDSYEVLKVNQLPNETEINRQLDELSKEKTGLEKNVSRFRLKDK